MTLTEKIERAGWSHKDAHRTAHDLARMVGPGTLTVKITTDLRVLMVEPAAEDPA